MVAAGCAALSALLMVLSLGLAAMIRQYREFTVPLVLLSGLAAVVLGVISEVTKAAWRVSAMLRRQ